MLKYPTFLLLLLPCYLQSSLAVSISASPYAWRPWKPIKGNCDVIINRRVEELRKTWPNCVMSIAISWLQGGASLTPNATVFEDIFIRLLDHESRTSIVSELKEKANGSIYWDLKLTKLRESDVKWREKTEWTWGLNNSISLDEAIRLIAASPVEHGPPDEWEYAYLQRVTDYEDWPDQVYWWFTTLGWDLYVGHRDRIVRSREPDSSSRKAKLTDIDSVLPNKGLVAERRAVTHKELRRPSRNRGPNLA